MPGAVPGISPLGGQNCPEACKAKALQCAQASTARGTQSCAGIMMGCGDSDIQGRNYACGNREESLWWGRIFSQEVNLRLIETLKVEDWENGWALTTSGFGVVPCSLMNSLVKEEHNAVHCGKENLLKHLQKSVISRNMVETIRSVTERCEICCRNNPKRLNKIQFGKTTVGQARGEYWQIDFTKLPRKDS